MALIVITPFVLNSADGEKKSFGIGEKITGALADHWYVQAHCNEESRAKRGRPAKDAAAADDDAADVAAEPSADAEAEPEGN